MYPKMNPAKETPCNRIKESRIVRLGSRKMQLQKALYFVSPSRIKQDTDGFIDDDIVADVAEF